ncbi:hypothetical protein, partial [Neisseria gonorrhoeae]|uniref:hypothetical protein n=1 Tax=Neisseria gonorrhoeae TaxID=485 RepID=UPI001B7FB5AF
SVQEIAGRDTVDVSEAAVGIALEIKAGDEIEQAAIGSVGDRNRQRLLVKGFDIITDETAQQPANAALLGVVLAQYLEFLLEGPEGPQAVRLLRKPSM